MLNWILKGMRLWIEFIGLHVAYETAICHNPPVHSFTGYRKNVTNTQWTNTFECCFYEIIESAGKGHNERTYY